MGYWGKVIGSFAGFAMGGPIGAIMGAALGHAADTGTGFAFGTGGFTPFGGAGAFGGRQSGFPFMNPARMAAMLGGRDQLFALGSVVLSAKLAKVDGPVRREEIDAFKRHFRVPPEAVRDIGRLFDQARDSPEGFETYADQLGDAFADNRGMLEDVLAALYAIARADGPVNPAEARFLGRVANGFGLGERESDRARSGAGRAASDSEPDPYAVLGVSRDASDEDIRAVWKRLMRENHPDGLAARGVPQSFVASASEKVARINAAWDRVKRERRL